MPTPFLQARQKRMLILLSVMTLATFGGPVGVWSVLRGGPSADWPPDRPVEWVALFGTAALVLSCMVAIVSMGLAHRNELVRAQARVRSGGVPR